MGKLYKPQYFLSSDIAMTYKDVLSKCTHVSRANNGNIK